MRGGRREGTEIMPIEGMGRCGGTATFSMFHNFGAPKARSFQWVKIRPVPSALYLEVESQPRPPWFTRHHLLHICQYRQIHLAGPIDGQLALPRAQQQRLGVTPPERRCARHLKASIQCPSLSIIIGDSHQAIESEPRPADHAGHGYKQRHFCSRVPILLVST